MKNYRKDGHGQILQTCGYCIFINAVLGANAGKYVFRCTEGGNLDEVDETGTCSRFQSYDALDPDPQCAEE